MKKNSFEENIKNLDEIIEKLENGDLNLNEAIKEYELAMKLIKASSKILNDAEGKLIKIMEENENIEFEEIE